MKFYPATKKIFLHLLAGLMWAGVGIMLVALASRWLHLGSIGGVVSLILAGLALAGAIYYFGFSRMARKNIRRIDTYPGPTPAATAAAAGDAPEISRRERPSDSHAGSDGSCGTSARSGAGGAPSMARSPGA